MGDFAERFIAGHQAGQAMLREKKRLENEEEDRDIQKTLLKHQLKEWDLEDRIKARTAAGQSFQFLDGTREADIPQSMRDTPRPYQGNPDAIASVPETVRPGNFETPQFKEMTFPGIPELGIPDVAKRPDTMEQILADTMAKARIAAYSKPISIPRGGKVIMPGGEEIQGNAFEYAPAAPVAVTNRNKDGVEHTDYLNPRNPSEPTGIPSSTRQPLPRRPPAQTILSMYGDQMGSPRTMAEGVVAGHTPVSAIPKNQFGTAVWNQLHEMGIDGNRLMAEQAATLQHMRTMNGDTITQVLIDADDTEKMLIDLKALNDTWKSKGYSKIRAALPGANPEAKQLLTSMETAAKNIQSQLVKLRISGATQTNQSAESAASLINSSMGTAKMDNAISALEKALTYKTIGIRNANAVMTSEGRLDDTTPHDTTSTTPSWVTSALASQPIGTHSFSDGSTWEKFADGTIKKIK